jgi:hypothetical protein
LRGNALVICDYTIALGGSHETCAPQIFASGRGRCGAAHGVADRAGRSISVAADHDDRAPRPIIDKLNIAVGDALGNPQVRQRFMEMGLELPAPEQQTPEALAAYQKAEIEKWWPIIKAAGIRGE